MANATRVETEIICYPSTAIPYRANNGFIIADVLGDTMNFGAGDSPGIGYQGQNPLASIPWLGGNSPTASSQSGVEFVRFYEDGTVAFGASTNAGGAKSILAGYILEGRLAALDCKVQGESPAPPDGGNFDLTWQSLQGKHKSVIPPVSPKKNSFLNTGKDVTAKARTVGTIPANRGLGFDCYFTTLDAGGPQAAFRVAIGDKYSLVGRHGMTWCVDRKVNGEWSQWRRLENAGRCNLHGQGYQLLFMRIAGYLVITVGSAGSLASYWLLEDGQAAPGQRSRSNPPEMTWPEAPLFVNAYNVRARVGVSLIKYASAGDVPFTGTFTRTFARATRATQEMLTTADCTGWSGAATKPAVTPSVGVGTVTYACTLHGSAQGIDTPFVNKVLLRSQPIWRQQDQAGINVEMTRCSALGIDKAMPPIQTRTEASFTLDRDLLLQHLPAWAQYIKQFNPITIRTRQHYDDGSTDDWVHQLSGYIYKLTFSTPNFGTRTVSLTCRDPIMRLQEENAVIDNHYPPLDFVFAEKLDSGEAAIYGADCIKEILSIALSPDEAARLNGNGDPLRYFIDPYPLIDTQNNAGGFFALQAGITGQALTNNGFLLPAKLLDDAMNWIGDFAKIDDALFFYGWPTGDATNWPCPIYGRLDVLLAGRPTYTLPDLKYLSGDINKLIRAMENEGKPERSINRWLVVGTAPQDSALAAITPSLFIGDARLPVGDPNAPEQSWTRTKVVRSEITSVRSPGLNLQQELANQIVSLVQGVDLDFPRYETRFMGYLQWGDKVRGKFEGTLPNIPDNTIGLNDKAFRVGKLTHSIPVTGLGATTTIWAGPLLNSGL